jgi:uncharacterized SAM-binding protein YcdF (DUF218 family)
MTYLQPALLVFFVFTAVSLARRRRRAAWVGLVLIFLWMWPPFAWLLSGSLEWFYPAAAMPAGDAQAIVVLGGATEPSNPSIPEPYVGWGTYQRCKHAAWLYHHWRAVPIIASGGAGESDVVIAKLMRTTLEADGVPAAAIATEERSGSTYENGVFTAAMLRSRGIQKIALVTHAYHMLRSEKVFRKQGIEVSPAPCAAYTAGLHLSIRNVFPSATALMADDNVLHEWVGLVCYKIMGRI